MLTHLSIRNYALIDKLEIDFFPEFTTITGETGAGKSVIIDALSLIIGQRADSQILKDKSQKCIIEGSFEINNYSLKDFFDKFSLDYETVVIVRREISPEGKSRAFINDTPVVLSQLKELGDKLIDIHSQHHSLQINETDFQLFVVDNYANIFEETIAFRNELRVLKELEKDLLIKLDIEIKSQKDYDYYKFIFDELEQANLVDSEQTELEQELETLSHIEQIKSVLSKTIYTFNGDENNCIQQIANLQNQLSQISRFEGKVDQNLKRLQSLYIELKDIVQELEQVEEKLIHSPERIEFINNRLSEIYRLEQKHHVNSITELIALKSEIDDKLFGMSSLETQINELKNLINHKQSELFLVAKNISLKRKKVFSELESKAENVLKMLGMPNARIKIENRISDTLSDSGIDNIFFTFSANKGIELKEISKIASGGEVSRLMLAFKSLISQKRMLPTIIFDEIDTGMSGEVATKTGQIMKELADGMQVIAITHLPQIAAKGNQQFQVYKTIDNNSTYINVRNLLSVDRLEVLAEMLSGNKITDASLTIARQMLS